MRGAAAAIGDFFGAVVTLLDLVSDCSYDLHVCLCPLSGGEVLYDPPVFCLTLRLDLA